MRRSGAEARQPSVGRSSSHWLPRWSVGASVQRVSSRLFPAALFAFALVVANGASGQSLTGVQDLTELTVGLNADAAYTAIALSPSDPGVAYLAG
ncbi:MAG: hypothetical protein ACJAYU_005410, partial [Bradymonadia bacterium]